MPLTLVDAELVVERKSLDLPEETKKPVVCVFDPIGMHAIILGFALGELLDRIEIFWQSQFSRTFIDMGNISEEVYPALIAIKRPILLISELEVIPREGHIWGVEMLRNLRRTAGLGDVPLAIISNADCLLRARGEAGNELGKLKINQFFTWMDLERKAKEQERLFDFVSQILGPKTAP